MQKKLTYGQKISMVAAAPVLGLSSSVDAAVVYKNPTPDIGISSSSNGNSVGWDIDGDGTNEFTLTDYNKSIKISATGSSSARIIGSKVFNFPSGSSIEKPLSPKLLRRSVTAWYSTVSSSSTYHKLLRGFSRNEKGYLGFQFNIDESSHYGWASITIDYGSLLIHDWAYNDVAGQAIKAGDTIGAAPVPLPPSAHLMLLALGAGGLTQWRSRRKAQESSQASA